MPMKNTNLISLLIIIIIIISFSSCGFIFHQVAAPNSCKKCEIQDSFGNIIWEKDACGGGTYNMEQRAKAKAYEKGCEYKVYCKTYQKEIVEN